MTPRHNARVVTAAMREPFAAAHGPVSQRALVLVELHDPESGRRGYGEAAPLPGYDGVTVDDVLKALDGSADGRPALPQAAAADGRPALPQAAAALDLARWDLAARIRGEPVWRLLAERDGVSLGERGAATVAAPVTVNATIAAPDRAGAAAAAAQARRAGFGTVKVKVGIGDDAGRVAAVRAAAGPEMAIRLDANGAWGEEEALRWLEVLAPAGIECCEEPVHGVEALARVAARTPVTIAIDESAADPAALQARACDAICLKIGRCGGITGMIDDARRARELGYDVYLASTLDGPLGIAAALHAAVAIVPDRPCGLATLAQFDGRPDPLPPHAGAIAVPEGPGLGGEELIGWYGS